MTDKTNKKQPNLPSYLVYGMIFGLFLGSFVSTFAMMFDYKFIQIVGVGMGYILGITVGALLYYMEDKKIAGRK